MSLPMHPLTTRLFEVCADEPDKKAVANAAISVCCATLRGMGYSWPQCAEMITDALLAIDEESDERPAN